MLGHSSVSREFTTTMFAARRVVAVGVCAALALMGVAASANANDRVSILVGTGTAGRNLDPLDPTKTQLNSPSSVLRLHYAPRDGAFLIADSGNHRVLIVSADGSRIARFAGTNREGNQIDSGNPKNTELKEPSGVTELRNGRVLIADTGNNRVLVVSKDGDSVDLFAGATRGNSVVRGDSIVQGDPKEIVLWRPSGVTELRDGRILITDSGNHRVLIVSADGSRIARFAGRGQEGGYIDQGDLKETQLKRPSGVTELRDGRILITDTGNDRLLAISADGISVDPFGKTAASRDPSWWLAGPNTISGPKNAIELGSGGILIADAHSHRLWEVTADGKGVERLVGVADGKAGNHLDRCNPQQTQLSSPSSVAEWDNGRILVADTGNHRVLVVTLLPSGGELSTLSSSSSSSPAITSTPPVSSSTQGSKRQREDGSGKERDGTDRALHEDKKANQASSDSPE